MQTTVAIMNTSYLGGEWYIDEMKTKANDAPGVPFSLPKSKYTFTNDWVPVDNRFDRAVDIKDVIEFVRSEDPRSKIKLSDGTMTDYIPTKRIALPVNKENAIASGIVAEKDRAQMVDTVYINLRKNSIDKTQLMILDMLANFDWKRPLYMTQVYILQDFGLMDTSSSTATPTVSCRSSLPCKTPGKSGASTRIMRRRCSGRHSATGISPTRGYMPIISSNTT